MNDMVGAWTKQTTSICASKYPAQLDFQTGTYRGTRGSGQGMIWWDAGIYRLEENDSKLVVSTATDELIAYPVILNEDQFEFTDGEGCTVKYGRMKV